jgi:hypothetical protein
MRSRNVASKTVKKLEIRQIIGINLVYTLALVLKVLIVDFHAVK